HHADQVIVAPPGAQPVLADRGTHRVVVDPNRDPGGRSGPATGRRPGRAVGRLVGPVVGPVVGQPAAHREVPPAGGVQRADRPGGGRGPARPCPPRPTASRPAASPAPPGRAGAGHSPRGVRAGGVGPGWACGGGQSGPPSRAASFAPPMSTASTGTAPYSA